MANYRFFHIGDIHIIDSRRDEYKCIFAKLYKSITDNLKADAKNIIALTGDIFDTKTRVSPINISDVHEFLLNLQNIAPVVMIPGNHDLNMNKPGGPDLLTPILYDSKSLDKITYWRNSGIYEAHGLTWVVSAPDGTIIQRDEELPKCATIGLMHEEIGGTKAFGYSFSGTRYDGTTVNKNELICDLTMSGHIHMRQLITPRASYCGSLIQRNFGESHLNHGYMMWDFNSDTRDVLATPIDIHNDNGFLTLQYCKDKNITVMPIPADPAAVRVEYQNCTDVFIINELASLKMKYNIKNVRKIAEDVIQPNNMATSGFMTNIGGEIASSHIQELLLRHLIRDEVMAEKVVKYHRMRYQHTHAGSNKTRWSIKSLNFNNMYCYGPDNLVDFANLKNCVSGIIAPNYHGKSSFLDILIFALYHKLPRGKTENILNHTYRNEAGLPSESFNVTAILDVDGQKVTIMRHGTKTGTRCSIHINDVNMTKGTLAETNKFIEQYIGTYEDAINTYIILQKDKTDFVSASKDERKVILTKLFQINIFDKIIKELKDDIHKINTECKSFETAISSINQANPNLSHDFIEQTIMRIHHLEDVELPARSELLAQKESEYMKFCKFARPADSGGINSGKHIDINKYLNDPDLIKTIDDLEIKVKSKINITQPMDAKPTKPAIARDDELMNALLFVGAEPIQNTKVDSMKPGELARIDANLSIEEIMAIISAPFNKDVAIALNNMTIHKDMPEELKASITIINSENMEKIEMIIKESARLIDMTKTFNVDIPSLPSNCPGLCGKIKISNDRIEQMRAIRDKYINAKNVIELYREKYTKQATNLNTAKLSLNRIVQNNTLYNLKQAKLYDEWAVYEATDKSQRDDFENYIKLTNVAAHIAKSLFEQKKTLESDKIKIIGETYMLKQLVETMKNNIKIRDELSEKLKDAAGTRTLMSTYKDALDDKKGIPSLLLRRNTNEFNNSVNLILSQFSDLQIELIDSFDILVRTGAAVAEPIEMSSGYQSFVISLACRIALCKVANISLMNGLIIDEGFSCVSDNHMQATIDYIHELGASSELFFIISHIETMQHAIERPLAITRIKGYSRIKNSNEVKEIKEEFSLQTDGKYKCNYCDVILTMAGCRRHAISKSHLKRK